MRSKALKWEMAHRLRNNVGTIICKWETPEKTWMVFNLKKAPQKCHFSITNTRNWRDLLKRVFCNCTFMSPFNWWLGNCFFNYTFHFPNCCLTFLTSLGAVNKFEPTKSDIKQGRPGTRSLNEYILTN